MLADPTERVKMATVRFPARRLLVASGCAATLAAAPLIAIVAPQSGPAAQSVANCYGTGGINMNLLQEGAPMPCNGSAGSPGAPNVGVPPAGGAPSQGLLTQCSGIPGCLSNALYGPGNVVVPRPDTTVHQSQ
jgi:hypothetical protein